MGSFVELNDTLQITTEQGFPADEFNLERHWSNPVSLADVEGKTYIWERKPGHRIYHPSSNRNFLVHNLDDGKWLYWGHILVTEQAMSGENKKDAITGGKYRIIKIYNPVYQFMKTQEESPEGLSYFAEFPDFEAARAHFLGTKI